MDLGRWFTSLPLYTLWPRPQWLCTCCSAAAFQGVRVHVDIFQLKKTAILSSTSPSKRLQQQDKINGQWNFRNGHANMQFGWPFCRSNFLAYNIVQCHKMKGCAINWLGCSHYNPSLTGNAGFETANHLTSKAAFVHIASRWAVISCVHSHDLLWSTLCNIISKLAITSRGSMQLTIVQGY